MMRKPAWLLAVCLLGGFLNSCDEPTAQEKELEKREMEGNGITVETPKVYDDSLLQQMLNSAETRLVSLQVLDQTGIAARFGSVTGASQQISSFAVSAQGP